MASVFSYGQMQVIEWLPALLVAALIVTFELLRHPAVLRLLRRLDKRTEATRASILAVSSTHQSFVDEKRLQGIDALWQGALVLRDYGKGRAVHLATPVTSKMSLTEKQEYFGHLLPNISEFVSEPALLNAHKFRPWVTPLSWSLFVAYEAVVGRLLSTLLVLSKGIEPNEVLFDSTKVEEMLLCLDPKAYAEFIPYGDAVVPRLLEYLESALLEEISRVISGKDADFAAADRLLRVALLAEASSADYRSHFSAEKN